MQVKIEHFNKKGLGVGLLPNGHEVEIPHLIPGDEALIEYRKKRRPPQKGRLLEILSPSFNRVKTVCPHALVCGGCCWQQLSYKAQLEEKQKRVVKAFGNRYSVDPILPCSTPFGYRNKMEFSFSQNRAGNRYLGLMIAAAGPYVFNVEECHLGPSWYSQVLCSVRSWWETSGLEAYYPPKDSGTLRYITLRHAMRTQQKMVILNISGHSDYAPSRSQLDGFVLAVRNVFDKEENISIFLRIHQAIKGRPTQFFEMLLHGPDHIVEELHLKRGILQVKISPTSFFQPNTLQAEVLYNTALSTLSPGSTVWDLYSGTGTLGLAAAQFAEKILGIELSPEAVLDAEENCKKNGITNAKFHQGDVGKLLTCWMAEEAFKRPDAVIVDPPRSGLDPLALHHLKILSPSRIVYISCNPTTQAENIEELLKAGYRLTRLQPVDQFPQTYHIENVAFLER